MNVSDTEMDSDTTFCEEVENNNSIDAELEEIQRAISSHHRRQVFMTKPQMKEYKEFLTGILPHLDIQKRSLATTFLAQLEIIAKIVENFERKWSSEHSLTTPSDDFPCSLLTNQDFVSQKEPTVINEVVKIKPTETEVEDTQFVETTQKHIEPAPNDEKKRFEANLEKTIAHIRQFKINFLKDLVVSKRNPLPSMASTTTSLVADEFKLSPGTDAKNRETVFKIQLEAKKWDLFSEKSESKEKQ